VLDVAMHVTDKERHVTLILAINQLNAQVLLLQKVYYAPLHVSSTMCSSSGGQNCIIQHLVSPQM
jgi:fructose-1,6-bisphosphatase/sedoheptulose 1,7-bisphosphatase-like protein